MTGARSARIILASGLTTAMVAGVVGVAVNIPAQAASAAATYATTANLNVRTGPSTSTKILTTLKKGTKVTGTGSVSKDWLPITYDGKKAYVCADYLKKSAASSSSSSVVTTTKKTTANVNLRTQPSLTSSIIKVIKKGSTVHVASKKSGQFSQVVVDGANRWMATRYLATPPKQAAASPATETLYINATNVNVRASATTKSASITMLQPGTALKSNGVKENSFTQVVYDGKNRWVYSTYLSTKKPDVTKDLGSSSLNKLEPAGKKAVVKVREEFPQIKTIYGWRASSDYSSDHPNGRAIDIMIPSYKSNKALGDKVADWVIKNAKSLDVKYIIWRQRYYPISRGTWSQMEDRGGDTENHMDHVHVSFYAS